MLLFQIALKTSITLQKHLRQEQKFLTKDKRGIHNLNCPACTRWYRGQAERSFKVRYNEPTHAVCNNNENSRYSQHILNTLHLRNDLESTFDVLDTQHKGSYLWCNTPDCYQFINFVFDVPLLHRHISTQIFAFVERLSCSFDYTFRLVHSHHQFSASFL
jgi:hypothetical protein